MDSGKLIRPGNGGNSPQPVDLPYPVVPHTYVPTAPTEPSLLDYWHILTKRKLYVLLAAGLLFGLTAINTFRTPKLYESVGRVAVYHEQSITDMKDGGPMASDDWDYTVAMETQVRVMQGDSLGLKVARDLGWDQQLTGRAPGATETSSGAIPLDTERLTPQQESALIGRLHTGLQINSIPNTRMIELRYSDPDPQMAARALNVFMADYIQENIRAKYESAMQASEWLTRQLAELRLKVETSQEKLVKYEKENDILGIDEKQNIITAKLNDLNKALTDATAERIQKEATYGLTSNSSPELIAKADPSSFIEQLRVKEAELKTQLAQVSTQFGPAYPKVQELNNQLQQVQESIATETKRISGRLQSDYLGSSRRENMLQAALNKQKQEANRLNERAIQYTLLKRDLDTNQQLYDNLLQRLKEAGVSAALKSSNIRIVDSARVPTSPSKPDVPRNLVLGLLAGLTAGIVLAFVIEVMDNTIRTPEQVQTISALPSLGVVPMSVPMGAGEGNGKDLTAWRPGKDAKVEVIAHSHPKSEIAESYRALRTSILLSALGTPPQVILVTSALPQEGKTTTCVNSGIVLAQQGGRVLVVDADLRRPSVHASLGIKAGGGLSTLLAGRNTLEEVLVRSPQMSNLYVLPAGPPPPHPAELLCSVRMKELLFEWRTRFDHIVIDTPPALSVTDAVALSVEADSVILVIRSGVTRKEALRRARDLLVRVNAKVTGVVVNAVDLRAPDLHHYYYSGYPEGYTYYDDSTTQKKR